jgi:hypothetical protein
MKKKWGRCKWWYGKEGTPDFEKCPYCPERLYCAGAKLKRKLSGKG